MSVPRIYLSIERFFEHMFVQKDEGIHCLILGRGGHMELNGKMIEEGFDLFLTVPKIGPAPHLMKEHIALYPCTVASLSAYRIVSTPHRLPHLIEKHACHGALPFCSNQPNNRQNIGYCQQANLPVYLPIS